MIGKELFASLTMAGKLAHDYLGFAFMIGIALMFVIWVRTISRAARTKWLAKGGGMVGGGHPRRASSTPGRNSFSGASCWAAQP